MLSYGISDSPEHCRHTRTPKGRYPRSSHGPGLRSGSDSVRPLIERLLIPGFVRFGQFIGRAESLDDSFSRPVFERLGDDQLVGFTLVRRSRVRTVFTVEHTSQLSALVNHTFGAFSSSDIIYLTQQIDCCLRHRITDDEAADDPGRQNGIV